MAHSEAKRATVRAAYVFDSLPLETAAIRAGVPARTAGRWKSEAKTAGDDWDKMRAATLMAGGGIEDVARQMLAEYVLQHRAMMESISTDAGLPTVAKVGMLASLADSFNKTVAASKKVLPETSELATALAVMHKLADYIRQHHPQHGPAFVEILEPFGDELARTYG